jgi:hypothetical protein
MNVVVSMTILCLVAMVAIWAPPYPVRRHPHMHAMDVLRDLNENPHGRCHCGAPLDQRGVCADGASCARDAWETGR